MPVWVGVRVGFWVLVRAKVWVGVGVGVRVWARFGLGWVEAGVMSSSFLPGSAK